jgi:hypothetical protein
VDPEHVEPMRRLGSWSGWPAVVFTGALASRSGLSENALPRFMSAVATALAGSVATPTICNRTLPNPVIESVLTRGTLAYFKQKQSSALSG